MELIFTTLYLLLPAYVANMVPVVAHRLQVLPSLALPIDRGHKQGGDYIFGNTKTWRGVILGIGAAMLVCAIQYILWQFNVVRVHVLTDFSAINPFLFGFVGGVGALGGDLVKSYFKRRLHIRSGLSWPIFDQLDFIVGYIIMTSLFIHWTVASMVTACLITLILHPLTNVTAYLLKIKSVWW